MHACVLPKQTEYHLFKTSQQISANSFQLDHLENSIVLNDPRVEKGFSKLKVGSEYTKDYPYSSELNRNEQILILKSINNKMIHNPLLISSSNLSILSEKSEISHELKEKWKKEVEHFNKCAEIYFYRHIIDFNELMNEDIKKFLLKKWNHTKKNMTNHKYQVVTLILRIQNNPSIENVKLEHMENVADNLNRKLFTVQSEAFFNLHQYSITDNLQHFYDNKSKIIRVSDDANVIQLSLKVLSKLFIYGNEFCINFKNEDDGRTFFESTETLPPKNVNCLEALEEIIELIITMNIEWSNVDKCIKYTETFKGEFKPKLLDDTMKSIFKKYKQKAGSNMICNKWNFIKGPQKLQLCTFNSTFFRDDGKIINISVKLEYQTKFGGEIMTKEELLKEWIQHKFQKDSLTLRYRIDVKSFQILTITQLTIDDIENELKEVYNCNPMQEFVILFNTLNCINRLPPDEYLIQAKNENNCNKLLIYKKSSNGKTILEDESFIIQSFSRKFLSIDQNVLTFVHLNEEMSPCSFKINKTKSYHKLPSYNLVKNQQMISSKKIITKKKNIKRKKNRKFCNKKKL